MQKLLAFDIGIKNPSYSVFYYYDNEITTIENVLTIKDNWTKFDKCILNNIIIMYKINTTDTILIEQQRGIRYIRLMSYIQGFFEGHGFNNVKIVKPFTFKMNLGSYYDRKKFSIDLFNRFISINKLTYSKISKMDDISDSFNLGILYLGKMKNNYKYFNIYNINRILETFDINSFTLKDLSTALI